MAGWIGVDFDGTLSHTRTGQPILPMVAHVRNMLDLGHDIRIMTARAAPDAGLPLDEVEEFCRKMFGKVLPITCMKDPDMLQLWDDRAITVEKNTGRILTQGV